MDINGGGVGMICWGRPGGGVDNMIGVGYIYVKREGVHIKEKGWGAY